MTSPVFLFLQQPFGKALYEALILAAELRHKLGKLTAELRVLNALAEKLGRRYAEVVADGKQLRHRGQALAGGDVVDIAPAVTEVVAHFIFGNALLHSQARNALTHECIVHFISSFYGEHNRRTLANIQRKNVFFLNSTLKYAIIVFGWAKLAR